MNSCTRVKKHFCHPRHVALFPPHVPAPWSHTSLSITSQ
uniref:Uncharacterized protein n=1 Tax=Anguilla anguilla TaxID=7936 RepID=A0A0E9VF83_ANGAN